MTKKVIMFFCLVLVSFISSRASCTESVKASVTFDYSLVSKKISNYVAGVTDSPFYDKGSYKYLSEGKFKLVEVFVWLSSPQRPSHMPGTQHFQQRDRMPQVSEDFDEGRLQLNIQIAKKQIRAIYESGAEPLVFMIVSSKPSDMEKFQKRVRRVIDELRSSAKDVGKDLLLFRFANEPDAKRFWGGTRKEFFETYTAWANTVKSLSYNFIVEAPGLASATGRNFMDEYYDEVNDFTKEFLSYCKTNKVPLDVFSFHYYGVSLSNLEKEIKAVKRELSKYPKLSPLFGEPKVAIDEWNIVVFGLEVNRYQKVFDTLHTAAHNVGAAILMARNDVWLSIRFGGTGIQKPGGEDRGPVFEGRDTRVEGTSGPRMTRKGDSGDFLMLDAQGNPKPVFYGYKGLNSIFSTPNLLTLVDELGVIAMAGRDEHQMNIVLSFYDEELAKKVLREEADYHINKEAATGQCEVKVRNFPWDRVKGTVEVSVYSVDEKCKLSLVENISISKKNTNEEFVIRFNKMTPSVAFVQVRW